MPIDTSKDKIVIYDFETNGLFDVLNQPIQVACKVIENGKETNYMRYIKCKWRLNGMITDMTGITDEILKEHGFEMKEVFLELKEMFKDALIVGHNILKFDNKFYNHCMQITGISIQQCLFPNQCFDTAGQFKAELMKETRNEKLSIGDWHKKILSTRAEGVNYKLPDAAKYYGIKYEGLSHRANVDVDITYEVFKKQLELIG